MNRTVKVKHLVLTGLILIGLVGLHFKYGLFTRYNFLTGQIDKMKGEYELVLYGNTSTEDKYLNVAARDFNFQYKFIGCIVSKPALRGIDDYNQIISNRLTEINGEGWEKELMDTVENLKD